MQRGPVVGPLAVVLLVVRSIPSGASPAVRKLVVARFLQLFICLVLVMLDVLVMTLTGMVRPVVAQRLIIVGVLPETLLVSKPAADSLYLEQGRTQTSYSGL